MNEPLLTSMMADLALIRSTFETCAMFPPGDSIREAMLSLIEDTRENLVRGLKSAVTDDVSSIAQDVSRFADWATTLAVYGYSRQRLDFWFGTQVFKEVATAEGGPGWIDLNYCHEFNRPCEGIREMAPDALYSAYLADLIESAENPENYETCFAFERNVQQKFLALAFCIHAGRRPGDSADGGQLQTAPVPRRPSPPYLTASAEEPIPDPPASPFEP